MRSAVFATLGRPPDALYYHLRILLRAGLVENAGNRKTGRRQEALFRALACDLRIDYDLARHSHEKTLTAVVGSMLRLATLTGAHALASKLRRAVDWLLHESGYAPELRSIRESRS